jgi:hypothetical protein
MSEKSSAGAAASLKGGGSKAAPITRIDPLQGRVVGDDGYLSGLLDKPGQDAAGAPEVRNHRNARLGVRIHEALQ